MWLVAAALAAYLPLLGIPLRGWLDFSAFYAAGSLAFTPGVMDLAAVVRWQAESGLPITPFPYPATVALAYAPLALLPYGVAAALHVAIMFGVLLLAVRLGADLLGIPQRWAMLGTLAWAPAAAGVISGQNTPLALLLVTLAATGLVRVRSGLTGLAIGILAYKPQLVAPQLGFLALRGRWLALLVALGAIGVHYALGVVATGGDTGWPARWLATISQYTAADHLAKWLAVREPAVRRHARRANAGHRRRDAGWLDRRRRHRRGLHPRPASAPATASGGPGCRGGTRHQPPCVGL